MDNLEPITRNEMFLNGDDLEPITREEMILAGADLEPITRHEWFLKKYRGGGGGGGYDLVNVPNLPADIASFNDGTDLPMASLKVAVTPYQDLHGYDAPWAGGAGKNKFDATTLVANVNNSVQYVTITLKPNTTYTMSTSLGKVDNVCNLFFMLPNESASSTSNGVYSGLSISVTSGNDGQVKVGYRLPSDGTTSAQYLAKQYQIEEGSTATSYAPYSNICPIIGWDEAVVTVADDAESPTTSHEYTIDLDGTRYGGVVDVVSGSGTMDKDSVSLNSIDAFSSDAVNENGYIRYNCGIVGKAHNFNILCDKIKVIQSTVQASANEELISGNANNNKLYFTIDSTKLSGDLSNSTGRSNALKTYLATNDIQVVYELATPITVQLAPTAIKSIEGENNISADCGQITEVKYFKKA